MDRVGTKASISPTQSAQPFLDRLIGELARDQHGVIALRQLVELGLTPSAVRDRVANGRLWRIYRGVYAVGHTALSPRGHYMAAVLACGPGAVLSHRSCAALRELRRSARQLIDVTAPGRRGRSIARIDAHRDDTLHPDDIDEVDGIACTSVARTLLDLAEVVDRRTLERACEQAEVLRVFDLRAIDAVLCRANGRRGLGALRDVLDEHRIVPIFTRRELEERLLRLCRDGGLPAPEVNVTIVADAGPAIEADFVWRCRQLVAETDGRAVHLTPAAFERDRRRDQRLMLAGWRVARFTWRQLDDEPGVVVATLRGLLAAG